jgi:hypothetical protein
VKRATSRATTLRAALALAALAALGGPAAAQPEQPAADPLARYYVELKAMKLVDVEDANLDTLRRELGLAEDLLKSGAFANAAVALYAIVKSPRYAAFTDFVEFQNAEYDLGVALARAGSYGAAKGGTEVDSFSEGDQGMIVVNQTPFYGESGGQVGDTGVIESENGARFRVTDTQKRADGLARPGARRRPSARCRACRAASACG